MLTRSDLDDLKRTFVPAWSVDDQAPPQDNVPLPTEYPDSADGERVLEPDLEPAAGGNNLPPERTGQDGKSYSIRQSPAQLNEWDAGERTEVPPPREWLLGNQFCRKFLSGLLAPGATGKTALRTLQYLALATGRPLTCQHVFKRSRVLLISMEDDDDELQRRLAAARIHYDIDPAELHGWLFCATPKGIKLADMKDGWILS
jgi:hypothetical protein